MNSIVKILFLHLIILLWTPFVLGQQCDVVVTRQAALNKQLKALLSNVDFGNVSCSNTCEDRIESLKAELDEKLEEKLSETLGNALNGVLAAVQSTISQQLDSLVAKLHYLYRMGSSPNYPALSCVDILLFVPGSRSGYYWIEDNPGLSRKLYCDMTRSCGGVTGGWMRVAEIDMRNSSHQCPRGLRQRTDSNKRTCVRNSDSAGCSSVTIPTVALKYSKVCGRIIGYQITSTNAFTGGSIDTPYVDGVSFTHGRPRQHIWSFAAALDEASGRGEFKCPCIAPGAASHPPSFVGNDYFCDTGSRQPYQHGTFYGADPLWDGAGCGPQSTCCSLNNPPWFFKQLPQPTTDDIEMRVCRDEVASNEDIAIETVEIYIR